MDKDIFEQSATSAQGDASTTGVPAQAPHAAPLVVTLLVNWRGVDDTIECVDSILGSDYSNNTVVVVDNGSSDGSIERLSAWARGELLTVRAAHEPRLGVAAPCKRPVPYRTLTLSDAQGHDAWASGVTLYIIDAQRNHGFAGGVNIGCSFALQNPYTAYVWVLNNDTVVATDCLTMMERRMQGDPNIGMCGSRIVFYWAPDKLQLLGGSRFQPLLGTSRHIGLGAPVSVSVDTVAVERQLDHLCGASMLVTRHFLETVGPMEERYFLYYEEVDWAVRARATFRLAYADKAVLYHKEGAAIGSSHDRRSRSPISVYFLVRSRVMFTRNMFPWALPSVYAYSLLVAFRAIVERRLMHAKAILDALLGRSPREALNWTPD